MKKTFSILAVILALAVLLPVLGGCGPAPSTGSGTSSNPAVAPTSVPRATPTPASTPTPSPTPSPEPTPDPVELLESYVQDGQYAKAIETYTGHISGNARSETAANDFLHDYLNTSWAAYQTGDMDRAELEIRLSVLRKIQNALGILPEVATAEDLLITVEQSRKVYASGLNALADGDLQKAISLFSRVSAHDDLNYQNAIAKKQDAIDEYAREVISSADEQAAEENYDLAIIAINDCLDFLAGEAPHSLNVALSGYRTDYVEQVLAEAKAAFGTEKDYSSALWVLLLARNIYDCDEFSAAWDMYCEYAPTYLVEDIDYLRCSDVKIEKEPISDNKGVEYSGHLSFRGEHMSSVLDWYDSISFDIDGKYSTFSGTIILPYQYRGTNRISTIEIFGDDKLLFSSGSIKSGFKTTNFTVKVSGKSVLKIVFYNTTGVSWDSTSCVGYLTNAYLSK